MIQSTHILQTLFILTMEPSNNITPVNDEYKPWTTELERIIMDEFQRLAAPHSSLSDPAVLNGVIDNVAREVAGLYGDVASMWLVKRRIQLIRERFRRFLNYIRMPGVKYNQATKRVEVGRHFWGHLTRQVSYGTDK